MDFNDEFIPLNEEEQKYKDYFDALEFVSIANSTFGKVEVSSNRLKYAYFQPEFFRHEDNDHIYSKHHNVQGMKKVFREYLVPRNNTLVSCDYSGFQTRILAYLSKDPNLMELCNNENIVVALKDIIAPELEKKPFKTFLYSFLFGAKKSTLALQIKQSKEYIEKILIEFKNNFPDAVSYRDSFTDHKGMNTEIRRISAIIFNSACIKVHDCNIRIALPLHDAIVVDANNDQEIETTIKIMEETGREYTNNLPFYAGEEEWTQN